MKTFLAYFYTCWWWVWFGMLLIGDPIASWLGQKYGVGDRFTDTHLIVRVLDPGLRAAVLGWLIWHFLVAHVRS